MYVSEMIRTSPRQPEVPTDALARCIEHCFACAQACSACADACLAEDGVARLRRCIRLDLDCADICAATGTVLSRQTEPEWSVLRKQLEACLAICQACGQECAGHGQHHEHCKVCARPAGPAPRAVAP